MLKHGTPSVTGVPRNQIMATSSSVSIVQLGVSERDVQKPDLEPYGVTEDVLDVRGRQSVSLALKGSEFEHSFLVCPLPTSAAGLLGAEFLRQIGANIDLNSGKIFPMDSARARDIALTRRKERVTFGKRKANRRLPYKTTKLPLKIRTYG